MSQCYSRPLAALTLLFATFLFTCVHAQTIFLQQDFEGGPDDDLPFTTDPATYSVGQDIWAVVTSIETIMPSSGTMFWGGRDIENNNGGRVGRNILSFDAGEICDLTSAQFVFDYNVFGFDGGDDLGYTLYIDGFQTEDVTLVDGSGDFSTNGWVTTSVNIPGTADNARLEIWIDQNGEPDYFGIDNIRVTATSTNGTCNDVCGVDASSDDVTFLCQSLTEGVDGVTAVIAYSGAETGVVVTTSIGTVEGDDPATVGDGEVLITGLQEGQSPTVNFNGGDCSFSLLFTVPGDQCEAGNVIVNEFQFSPSAEEFIEVVSISATPLDVTGYTIEDATGNQVAFPAITLEFGDGIVFAVDVNTASSGCSAVVPINGFGLNDGGDIIIIRDASGSVVDQVTYTGNEVSSGESLARNPDADPNGVFEPHSSVSTGTQRSPCRENQNPAVGLPLDLLRFTATSGAKTVALHWTTANEEAVADFVVERQASDNDWIVLGTLRAANTVSATYRFEDEQPQEGVNLYRLRQRDADGTTVIHGPVSARLVTNQPTAYPNPATTEVLLSGDLSAATISLLDATGRHLQELPGGTDRLDVSTLKSGVYTLRIRRGGELHTLRFVKQ